MSKKESDVDTIVECRYTYCKVKTKNTVSLMESISPSQHNDSYLINRFILKWFTSETPNLK